MLQTPFNEISENCFHWCLFLHTDLVCLSARFSSADGQRFSEPVRVEVTNYQVSPGPSGHAACALPRVSAVLACLLAALLHVVH